MSNGFIKLWKCVHHIVCFNSFKSVATSNVFLILFCWIFQHSGWCFLDLNFVHVVLYENHCISQNWVKVKIEDFGHHLDIQIQFYLKTSTTRIVFDDFVEIRLRQGYIAVSVATLFQRNLKITTAFDFEHSDCLQN